MGLARALYATIFYYAALHKSIFAAIAPQGNSCTTMWLLKCYAICICGNDCSVNPFCAKLKSASNLPAPKNNYTLHKKIAA
jgi:hypothetical protein